MYLYIYVATSVMGYAFLFRPLAGFSLGEQWHQISLFQLYPSVFSASPGHKNSLVLIETM